jgi:mono/diheme cytochrome c family protein
MRGPICLAFLLGLVFLDGCSEHDMVTQPKYKTLQPSDFFTDGQSSRPVVPGTIARGHLRINPIHDDGMVNGVLAEYIPLKEFDPKSTLDAKEVQNARLKTLERGRERYNIYCSPCHSQLGDGNGMIVQRGFSRPPSFHEPRLVDAPPGHFFHVITNGYGAMYSYASRIEPDDRWAIVAYIRALQLSQNAKLDDVPTGTRTELTSSIEPKPGGAGQ